MAGQLREVGLPGDHGPVPRRGQRCLAGVRRPAIGEITRTDIERLAASLTDA